MDGCAGHGSVSFRFPFFGVPFGFDESLGEWASMRVEVIGECVGEWVAVNGIRLWCSICLGHPKASIGVLVLG